MSGSQITTLTIERLVAGGDGLARDANGRVTFVSGALPGETVEVDVQHTSRDFATATLLRIIDPSPHRTAPPCSFVAAGCGGCDWQHIGPDAQRTAKLDIVREAWRRTARLPDVDIVAGPELPATARRTTVRTAVGANGKLGFRRQRSHDVIEIDECMVTHPAIVDLLGAVSVRGSGEVSLRCSTSTGERAVMAHDKARLLGLPDDVGRGAGATITQHVAGVPLRVSMGSFFQASPEAAELLVSLVGAAAGREYLSGERGTVVDAYGGIGLFAATLLDRDVPCIVVESNERACADADRNLEHHDVEIVCIAVEQWHAQPAGLVIADPARAGLGRAGVTSLLATEAERIVLVSCDPVAGARDARLLVDAGYDAHGVTVVDLFPHTHHVEVVAAFDRR